MDNPWKFLAEQCKAFGAGSAVYTAVGSFLLYLLGYLVTRFQLTMLGVGTNLDVLEERYFFAGAKFAVYLLATIPSLLLLLALPLVILWLVARVLPPRLRGLKPSTLYLAGIVFSVVAIQFVGRQCFVFSNLLLAESLPGPGWLQAVLLEDQETYSPLFFVALLGATAISAGFLFAGRNRAAEGESGTLKGLLALLVILQALLLPINYSILIAHKNFPRVQTAAAAPGQTAWLIWENNDKTTLLVAQSANPKMDRALITIDRKANPADDRIVAYDPLLRILFAPPK